MKYLLACLAALLLLPLGALERKWNAAELIKWKSSVENGAALDADAVRAVSAPVLLESKIHFAKGQFQGLKISLRLSERAPVAPVTLIALFQGGKEAGNHYWNTIIRQGTDHGGPLYECYLTVPGDATEIGLKLWLGAGGSTAKVREITVTDITPANLTDRTVRLSVDPNMVASKPTAFHFGANIDSSNFPGIYYGSLPADAKGSKRMEFVEFLKKCQLRAARYPGGTASHWHLPESREACQKLMKLCTTRNAPMMVGFREFCDVMKEAGVKVVYQLNTSFYLDAQGEIQAIDATHFPKQAKLDISERRHAEAAAALERNFKNGILKPADVDYWELGNEEFATMTVEQYAKVCAALIPVVAANDPGKPICVTGIKGLEEELQKYPDVWDKITGVTTHYPYASWPRPSPSYMTADYRAFANADVNYPRNLDNPAKRNSKKITVSETTVYNLFTYDFSRMQPSFALGLAIAKNWPELMIRPEVDMAIFHDFESTYFGLTFFDVSFSEINRGFKWLNGQAPPKPTAANANWYVDPSAANSNKYFPMQYVDSPGMKTLGMLSAFAGGSLYAAKAQANFGINGGYLAGTNADGKPAVFVSNPLEEPVLLQLDYPGFPEKCRMRRLDTDSFGATLPNEYRDNEREITLTGGKLILPARSITLLSAL